MFVLHSCDVRPCVNPSHLRLGTFSDNMQDMHRRGRGQDNKGVKHPKARLTEDQVLAIRAARANGVTEKTLASQYGITQASVGYIHRRRNWKHL